MKKLLIAASIFAIIFAFATKVNAQGLSATKMKAYYAAHQKVEPTKFKLTTDQVSGTGTIVLLTPDINFQFTRLQKTEGNWTFGGSIMPSVSYNLVIGEGTKNADGSVTVNPYVSFGAFAGYGVVQGTNGALVSAADIGGCLGIYKYVTIAGGYDAVNNKPFFAIGAKISTFNFRGGSGATLISFK